jgi:hypothetical protein
MTISVPCVLYFLLLAISASATERPVEPENEALVERSFWAIDVIKNNHRQFRKLQSTDPRPHDLAAKFLKLEKERKQARSKVDILFSKLKKGDSVFSYPGLLTLGRTRYCRSDDGDEASRRTYTLKILVGFSDTDAGGFESRYYEVKFDNEGLILSHGMRPRWVE